MTSGAAADERDLGHLPGYVRIAEGLAARIRSGELPIGSRLPSERELAGDLDVSRIMTRHALQWLEQRGLVDRVQGSGTFVARRLVEYQGGRMVMFSDEMRRQGIVPGSEVLSRAVMPASPSVARSLDIATGRDVLRVVRRLTGNGIALALSDCYHALSLYPTLPDLDLTLSHDVLVSQHYDSHPTRMRREIRARHAEPDESRALGIPEGEAMLEIDWVGWDQLGRAWGCGREAYRATATSIVVEASTEESR